MEDISFAKRCAAGSGRFAIIGCVIIAASMAESTYAEAITADHLKAASAPRHLALVRITHWVTTFSFFALVVSGVAILISHPRLYWGETGNFQTPSLIDLPLPFLLANQNGWGRYLHFQSAWVVVLTGIAYALFGVWTQHFRKNMLPVRGELNWRSLSMAMSAHIRLKPSAAESGFAYNVLQRITYLTVIFGLFPLMIWTGLAMSPALTSVFPALVTVLGGQQSARTIHFFGFVLLTVFVVVHVVMIVLSGFRSRMRAMITGMRISRKETA
jgi:thiosulfate reductase cytochrome b subunit